MRRDDGRQYNRAFYERYVNDAQELAISAMEVGEDDLRVYQEFIRTKKGEQTSAQNASGYARWLQVSAPQ